MAIIPKNTQIIAIWCCPYFSAVGSSLYREIYTVMQLPG